MLDPTRKSPLLLFLPSQKNIQLGVKRLRSGGEGMKSSHQTRGGSWTVDVLGLVGNGEWSPKIYSP